MVLLTYPTGSKPRTDSASSTSIVSGDQETVENDEGKQEVPKTPYMERMNVFKEDDAYREKCDLYFICQDGEIPAHRLVISNASKYIMAMQDDQVIKKFKSFLQNLGKSQNSFIQFCFRYNSLRGTLSTYQFQT